MLTRDNIAVQNTIKQEFKTIEGAANRRNLWDL